MSSPVTPVLGNVSTYWLVAPLTFMVLSVPIWLYVWLVPVPPPAMARRASCSTFRWLRSVSGVGAGHQHYISCQAISKSSHMTRSTATTASNLSHQVTSTSGGSQAPHDHTRSSRCAPAASGSSGSSDWLLLFARYRHSRQYVVSVPYRNVCNSICEWNI